MSRRINGAVDCLQSNIIATEKTGCKEASLIADIVTHTVAGHGNDGGEERERKCGRQRSRLQSHREREGDYKRGYSGKGLCPYLEDIEIARTTVTATW